MIPGEIFPAEGDILLNAGAPVTTLKVSNTGDRPIQVGSHYHFAETNAGLSFDREAARGQRLDIPAGTAVRFEPVDPAQAVKALRSHRREMERLAERVRPVVRPLEDVEHLLSVNLIDGVYAEQPEER